MHLSDFQTKEIINISTGKRFGYIVDVVIDKEGRIKELILEEKRGSKRFMVSREELSIEWSQIVKIGDDIILVDTRKKTF